jgi:hypothetical protein
MSANQHTLSDYLPSRVTVQSSSNTVITILLRLIRFNHASKHSAILLSCLYTAVAGENNLTIRGLRYSEITHVGSHNGSFVGNSLSAN